MVDSHSYLIGIDGGGTSCRFALQAGRERHVLTLGSANVFTDRESAVSTLVSGLNGLMDQAGLPARLLNDIPVYAGLAGVTGPEAAQQVSGRLPVRKVIVEDDRRSAVTGGLGGQPGCLIGIGTGSFLARQGTRELRFAGGYGPDLGDEASGNWLGRGLLRRALRVLDGNAASSKLVADCIEQFGGSAVDIVVFSSSARPSDYAKLAPQIIDAGLRGDTVARELMQAGADYIVAGLHALGYRSGEAICAAGGIARHYAGYLPPRMEEDLIEPRGTALDGAVMLASALAQRTGQGVA